jgi:hypothetical protein
MFLSRLAERSGLLEFLAPRRSKHEKDDTLGDKDERKGSPKDDKKKSNKEDSVERQRKRRLDAQRKLEAEAESRGAFAKKQRVKYYHKATGEWYDDAHIVGVHFDDGIDKPYYVRYLRYVSLLRRNYRFSNPVPCYCDVIADNQVPYWQETANRVLCGKANDVGSTQTCTMGPDCHVGACKVIRVDICFDLGFSTT